MARKSLTLAELAEKIDAELIGDPSHTITGYAGLDTATEKDVSFFSNPLYKNQVPRSQAGVIIAPPSFSPIAGKNFLLSKDPSASFQKVLELFYEEEKARSGFRHIHPTAVIHETAQLGDHVEVGPYAVIDKGCRIGKNTIIGSGTYLGPFVTIGTDCYLYPHVVIREFCQIGSRVVIQPGAVLGACGFGYLTTKDGVHHKLKQVGNVVVEDDVEIGANAAIDRARFGSTRIGQGSKVDNLVLVAHNVQIGRHNIIVGQTGIAGSTKIGDRVWIAGHVAINGHITIADDVMIAAKSGVSKSLNKAGKYSGFPVLPLEKYNRISVLIRNLEKVIQEIKTGKEGSQ